MENKSIKSRTVIKYRKAGLQKVQDEVAEEFPLTIRVNGQEFATMVCSPGDLEELVIGFLASEGLIRFYQDIVSFSINEKVGFADVELVNQQTISQQFYSKRFIGSCCGKSRQFYLHNDARTAKTILSRTQITVDQCFQLIELMQSGSTDFIQTGGMHNAVLCTTDQVLISRSDIGRHNALDKIFGYCIKNGITPSKKIIAFSGRISSEVLLKAAKIGIGIVLSKSAPTTLALDLAEDLGITVIGFIRGSSLNVYTHPERVVEIPTCIAEGN